MRVVISAPRKTGGSQLRCLLSMAYDLKAPPAPAPGADDLTAVSTWLEELPEMSVSNCDLPFAALQAPALGAGVHVIGVIRHPFDLFVSNFDVAQQRAARGREEDRAGQGWSILAGEQLDGEAAQAYAASGFAREVGALRDWAFSGCCVRYEDLLADPANVLASLSLALGALTAEQIRHAVSLCPAENVVVSRPGRGRRMPSLPPGAWRERLPSVMLETLRAGYAADVTALGYDGS
ncbi:MAG: hypothetical protein M3Z20_08790 [Chloroflexota bacterium]|nr:hypothetical protein [Chloroflexota bacterium]